MTDLRSTAETRPPGADDGQRSAVGGRWSAALLAWFAAHARPLPWRVERRDPYHVWLSETMAQQTRIAAVLPYFERWLQRFPTITALADAPLDDVLKAWEGLGYYSRARNLHRAARRIRDELGGRFPDDVPGLLSLPGVGRYTAGAVASLAFGRHAAVVDGNVRRVFARVFALPAERSRDADLWPLAEELLPPGRAGEFNEALMELGALVCTPRNPKCGECPLREHCAAHAADAVAQFPQKKPRAATPERTILTALVRRADGRLLLGQRPHDGLLGGLWEFVGEEYDDGRGTADDGRGTADDGRGTADVLSALLLRRTGVRVQDVSEPFAEVRHAFTHFKVRRLLHRATAADDSPGAPGDYVQLRWADPEEIAALALTRSDRRIAGML